MEDKNLIASDCIVISCCCQCLILQIIFFLLLKLPYKLVQKSKQYAKRKLGRPRKREPTIIERQLTNRYGEEFDAVHGGSMRVVEEESMTGCEFCMEEVEKVLEEFYEKGEFAFGSFWSKEEPGNLLMGI
ncbi:hypothetical protein U1Q18_029487 [Sarracenia purpurea var. burkii]